MWSIGQIVALASQRAVQFGDATGIKYRLINGNVIWSAVRCHARKNALDQIGGIGIVRQIHTVKQVYPVATVGHNRIRETGAPQVVPCPTSGRNRSAMLFVGGTDAGWAHRIEVDKQPSAMQDVHVRRGDCRAVLKAVCRARQ